MSRSRAKVAGESLADHQLREEISMVEVGQKLWKVFHDKRRGDPCEVEVVKVGRKWATLNRYHGRIDLETLSVDGGGYSSPARCYLSREVYELERSTEIEWAKLKSELLYKSRPADVTIENIKQARNLLGLPQVTDHDQ